MPRYPDHFFPNQLDRYAKNPALVTADGTLLTYEKFLAEADGIGQSLGPQRHLVFIEGSNHPSTLMALYGCLRAGHVVYLLEPNRDEITQELVASFSPGVHIRCTAHGYDILRPNSESPPLHPDLALLLSTSGSTGTRKLVKLSWQNLQANTVSISTYLGLSSADCAITSLKPHYSYGLSVLNTHMQVGASLILTDLSVQDPSFWALLTQHKATSFSGVPYTFQMIERAATNLGQFPSLRYVTQAGGRLDAQLVRHFAELGEQQGWQFFVMYGQTEAAPRISYLPPAQAKDHPDCIGIAVPGGQLSLRLDDGRETTTPGQEGELIYRGPNVMIGYAYTHKDLAGAEDIPFLATGDMATVTPAGLFRITGRKARFVKPYGLRISLDDLEQYAASLGAPLVAVGSDHMIALCSEVTLNAENIIPALCSRTGLPANLFCLLAVEKFPLLGNGKIDYRSLLDIAQTKRSPAERVPQDRIGWLARFFKGSVQETLSILAGQKNQWSSVQDIFQTFFPAAQLTGTETFLSLQGDSLIHVQVSLALEDYLGELPSGWYEKSLRELEAAHA